MSKTGQIVALVIAGTIIGGLLRFHNRAPAVHPPAVESAAGAGSNVHGLDFPASVGVPALLENAFAARGNATRQSFAALRQALAALPRAKAVAAIRQFLDSKRDGPTHLGFKLASNGQLDEAPTWRVFLLDELARLDPAAAAAYAKVILASPDSPEEWAVALRSVALGDSTAEGTALLQAKLQELLHNPNWLANPSDGFLEAFDVAVYLNDAKLLPVMAGLASGGNNPAVTHAAFLVLDRLVQQNPAAMLAALAVDPSVAADHPQMRADFFARADVRDPGQKSILENYLLNPALAAAELNTFAGTFPNANMMVSPNLLTHEAPPGRADLEARDAAALTAVQEWMQENRFANLRPQLQAMAVRLQGFVNQENHPAH